MPRGFPLGESYSPRKLGGGTQVWRFAQDDRGVLYAANNQTLLEFDGERWRTHEMPETRWVYSVGIDEDGSVFVGASGLLARMQPDSTGKLQAVSLMDRLDPKLAAFDRVYDVLVAPEGVYFVTRQRIFLYHREGTFQSWGSETAFWGAWLVEGRLFTFEDGEGFRVLEKDGFRTLAPAPEFPGGVVGVFPGEGDGPAIVAPGRGLLALEGSELKDLDVEASRILRESRVDWSFGLKDRRFAFVLVDAKTIYLFDPLGSLQYTLDERAGLGDQTPLTIFLDDQRDAWVGSNDGILHLPLEPLTVFDQRAGLRGIQVSAWHDGAMYVTDVEQLFRVGPPTGAPDGTTGRSSPGGVREGPARRSSPAQALETVPGIEGWIFGLVDVGEELLIGTERGVYVYRDGRVRLDVDGVTVGRMAWNARWPEFVYLLTSVGHVGFATREGDGRWAKGPLLTHLQANPVQALSLGDVLWVSTESNGLFRVEVEGDSARAVDHFTVDDGLPTNVGLPLLNVDGRLLVGAEEGLLAFEPATGSFRPDTSALARATAHSGSVFLLEILSDGGVLVGSDEGTLLLRRDGKGGYETTPSSLGRMGAPPQGVAQDPERGTLWLSGDFLYRYDPAKDRLKRMPDLAGFSALVRRVSDEEGMDLFLGSPGIVEDPVGVVDFSKNELRFEYAATAFGGEGFREYRTRLEGFDEGWKDWTAEADATYTNLPPGSYTFRVQARDQLGRSGPEGTYRFQVLPPWYRTRTAYLFYLLASVLAVTGIVRLRSYQLERRNRMLEELVALRTAELKASNDALTESLKEIKLLQGIIPICAACKKVRGDQGYWEQVEVYIGKHSDAHFTHGMCPECIEEYYGEVGIELDGASEEASDDKVEMS